MHYFTLVGSRQTPDDQAIILRNYAERLLRKGWTGRSGVSGSADMALNHAIYDYDAPAEFYIPWEQFNGYSHGDLSGRVIYPKRLGNDKEATRMIMEVHRFWGMLTRGAKCLHVRNAYQVLGRDLASPSDVLICWAPVNRNGAVQGGTATAYNLAMKHEIACFNLAVPGQREALDLWLKSKEL